MNKNKQFNEDDETEIVAEDSEDNSELIEGDRRGKGMMGGMIMMMRSAAHIDSGMRMTGKRHKE